MTIQMISIDDMSEIFQVSTKTVRRWSESGILPLPRKIGGTLRWLDCEVEAWILNRAAYRKNMAAAETPIGLDACSVDCFSRDSVAGDNGCLSSQPAGTNRRI